MDLVRIVLADDQALIRAGFRALINSTDDLEVVGEASNGAEAVDMVRRRRADVVLMDIRMPGSDGLAATRQITEDDDLAGVKVIILTTFEIDRYVYEALRAGASGFLGKGVEPEELIDAIRLVAAGEALLSPTATGNLVRRFHTGPTDRRRLDDLTEREREITTLVATGLTNNEIAKRLFISPFTVKTHVNRAMVKLGARDRAQLVVAAFHTGLAHIVPGHDP
ncbi:response regulator [Pseudonocardia acaciae]|uniref:response regulator n=1 Tax=Pseudonocardia acaciae TaxID=551276 RepID=UPI00049102F0|nr:response regulator transcription factor [Pseudonocardia acaciae]